MNKKISFENVGYMNERINTLCKQTRRFLLLLLHQWHPLQYCNSHTPGSLRQARKIAESSFKHMLCAPPQHRPFRLCVMNHRRVSSPQHSMWACFCRWPSIPQWLHGVPLLLWRRSQSSALHTLPVSFIQSRSDMGYPQLVLLPRPQNAGRWCASSKLACKASGPND